MEDFHISYGNRQSSEGKCAVTVDAVIPTFRPGKRLMDILKLLERQTVTVRRVRIINSGREGFDSFLNGEKLTEQELLSRFPFLVLEHIRTEEFDHGATRSRAFAECEGADYVLAMTQDALPQGNTLVEELLKPLEADAKTAVCYARQLPNPDASCEERISRAFNYPDRSCVKTQADTGTMGIKAYFCSNVCAMYRKKLWEELGGFPKRAIFNEDMIYAGTALQAGYRVYYAADACVFHSHSYTATQQFHRNFDLGVSQAQNPQIFAELSSEGEGLQYVKAVVREMQRDHKAGKIPGFVLNCAARLAGYRMGKAYQHLPDWMVLRCTSNRNFWTQKQQG